MMDSEPVVDMTRTAITNLLRGTSNADEQVICHRCLELQEEEIDRLRAGIREDARLYVRAITTISSQREEIANMRESSLAIQEVATKQYAKTPEGWLARIIEDTQKRAAAEAARGET